MMMIGALELKDGPVLVVVATDRDRDGGMHLLDVQPDTRPAEPALGADVLARLRSRGLYVDREQTLPVFFDRSGGALPAEVARLLARKR
jgi:hypothetical protein